MTEQELSETSLQIDVVQDRYRKGEIHPHAFFKTLIARIEAKKDNNAWCFLPPAEHVLGKALWLEREWAKDPNTVFDRLPLFGVPFTVKDNYDVAGYPTTAACPDFSYVPWETAHAIQKIEQAGAILVGKCNMDQFATGLVGVRSPYGTPRNPWNPEYCPGGSSSGSGVVVADGLCSFSIGTDTAGSGRIPAAFTNVVGCKPTKGLVSTHGMVPACRNLDCFSIFGLSVADTFRVLQLVKGFDAADDFSVEEPNYWHLKDNHPKSRKPRFGIPKGHGLAFFGNTDGQLELYDSARKKIENLTGGTFVEIDFTPFTETARILYEGAYLSQRLSSLKDFFAQKPNSIWPITKKIIERGADFSAVDLFIAERKLEHLRRQAYQIWAEADIDMLVVPTASITPTISEVLNLPGNINTMLGYYTNFVNLLNLSALAVPNGFLPNGMPQGITLIGKAFQDRNLAVLGRRFQEANDLELGKTGFRLCESPAFPAPPKPEQFNYEI